LESEAVLNAVAAVATQSLAVLPPLRELVEPHSRRPFVGTSHSMRTDWDATPGARAVDNRQHLLSEPSAGYDGWERSGSPDTENCQPRSPRFVDKEGGRWTVRTAHEEDADGLAEMYAAFSAVDRAQGMPPAADRRRRSWVEMLLEEGHNIVAEGANGLVGHVVCTPIDADNPELAVFVHPDFHDRGICTELCHHAAAAAAEAECESLKLHVERRNRAAISVYRRIGFELVDGEHDMRMVLPLDDSVAAAVRAPPAEQSPTA